MKQEINETVETMRKAQLSGGGGSYLDNLGYIEEAERMKSREESSRVGKKQHRLS